MWTAGSAVSLADNVSAPQDAILSTGANGEAAAAPDYIHSAVRITASEPKVENCEKVTGSSDVGVALEKMQPLGGSAGAGGCCSCPQRSSGTADSSHLATRRSSDGSMRQQRHHATGRICKGKRSRRQSLLEHAAAAGHHRSVASVSGLTSAIPRATLADESQLHIYQNNDLASSFKDCEAAAASIQQLQHLGEKRKAAFLRDTIEAACNRNASMVVFSRAAAASLSSALRCPLVLVCAYDNETEELYCCFYSSSFQSLFPQQKKQFASGSDIVSAPTAPLSNSTDACLSEKHLSLTAASPQSSSAASAVPTNTYSRTAGPYLAAELEKSKPPVHRQLGAIDKCTNHEEESVGCLQQQISTSEPVHILDASRKITVQLEEHSLQPQHRDSRMSLSDTVEEGKTPAVLPVVSAESTDLLDTTPVAGTGAANRNCCAGSPGFLEGRQQECGAFQQMPQNDNTAAEFPFFCRGQVNSFSVEGEKAFEDRFTLLSQQLQKFLQWRYLEDREATDAVKISPDSKDPQSTFFCSNSTPLHAQAMKSKDRKEDSSSAGVLFEKPIRVSSRFQKYSKKCQDRQRLSGIATIVENDEHRSADLIKASENNDTFAASQRQQQLQHHSVRRKDFLAVTGKPKDELFFRVNSTLQQEERLLQQQQQQSSSSNLSASSTCSEAAIKGKHLRGSLRTPTRSIENTLPFTIKEINAEKNIIPVASSYPSSSEAPTEKSVTAAPEAVALTTEAAESASASDVKFFPFCTDQEQSAAADFQRPMGKKGAGHNNIKRRSINFAVDAEEGAAREELAKKEALVFTLTSGCIGRLFSKITSDDVQVCWYDSCKDEVMSYVEEDENLPLSNLLSKRVAAETPLLQSPEEFIQKNCQMVKEPQQVQVRKNRRASICSLRTTTAAAGGGDDELLRSVCPNILITSPVSSLSSSSSLSRSLSFTKNQKDRRFFPEVAEKSPKSFFETKKSAAEDFSRSFLKNPAAAPAETEAADLLGTAALSGGGTVPIFDLSDKSDTSSLQPRKKSSSSSRNNFLRHYYDECVTSTLDSNNSTSLMSQSQLPNVSTTGREARGTFPSGLFFETFSESGRKGDSFPSQFEKNIHSTVGDGPVSPSEENNNAGLTEQTFFAAKTDIENPPLRLLVRRLVDRCGCRRAVLRRMKAARFDYSASTLSARKSTATSTSSSSGWWWHPSAAPRDSFSAVAKEVVPETAVIGFSKPHVRSNSNSSSNSSSSNSQEGSCPPTTSGDYPYLAPAEPARTAGSAVVEGVTAASRVEAASAAGVDAASSDFSYYNGLGQAGAGRRDQFSAVALEEERFFDDEGAAEKKSTNACVSTSKKVFTSVVDEEAKSARLAASDAAKIAATAATTAPATETLISVSNRAPLHAVSATDMRDFSDSKGEGESLQKKDSLNDSSSAPRYSVFTPHAVQAGETLSRRPPPIGKDLDRNSSLFLHSGGVRRRSALSCSLASSNRSSVNTLRRSLQQRIREQRRRLGSNSSRATDDWTQQHTECPLGFIVCVEPFAPLGESACLLNEVAAAVEPLLLNILEIEWLRRERTRKALQLELHRTVFQESINALRKVERLLALVHTTLAAEQVAFFLIDAQNSAFVCLGGALSARGLTLPLTHPLLGEAIRQHGRIVIANYLPPGLNKDYDYASLVNTRSAMVVPLMDGQGHVKALLLVVNRCLCMRSCLLPNASSFLTAAAAFSGGEHTTVSPVSYTVRSQRPATGGSSESSVSSPYSGGEEGVLSLRRKEPSTTRSAWTKKHSKKGSLSCSCPACSFSDRKNLSYYGELLHNTPFTNVLKVSRKFTREDEVLLQCVQREIQNALGGALINLCIAGMTLLKPKRTMVSYVVAEPDSYFGFLKPAKSADEMLDEIQNIVDEGKRLQYRRLRRCQSMAIGSKNAGDSRLLISSWRGRSLDCVKNTLDAFSLSSDSSKSPSKRTDNDHREKPKSGTDFDTDGTEKEDIAVYSKVDTDNKKPDTRKSKNAATPDSILSTSGTDFAAIATGAEKGVPTSILSSRATGDSLKRLDLTTGTASGGDAASNPMMVVKKACTAAVVAGLHAVQEEIEEENEWMNALPNRAATQSRRRSKKETISRLRSRRRKRCRRAVSLPTLIFSGALKNCEDHMKLLRKDMLLAQYRRWDLDVWKRNRGEFEMFFLLALDELGVLEIKEEPRIRQFFQTIADGYHTDNPYHNFYHAMHVFQVCWMFLSTYGGRKILTPVEQLSILLAALSHDVDHPGVNNAFLRAELNPLSIMYNDRAVLENHHAAFAVRTLMQLNVCGGGESRKVVFGASGEVEKAEETRKTDSERPIVPSFCELRRLLIQAIFATDMELFRKHHDAMKRRAQMKSSDREELQGEEDRSLLVTCLIHCADICNPVMAGGRNIQWASLVTQEFNAQVDLERRFGLPITEFMNTRTEIARIQSQIGFLSYVVLDQFRAFAELVSDAEELVQQGEKNLDTWKAALQTYEAAEEARRRGETFLVPPSHFNFRLKHLEFAGMRGPKCFGYTRSQTFDGYRPPSLVG